MTPRDSTPLAPASRFGRRWLAVACAAGIVAFPIVAKARADTGGSEALLKTWAVAIALLVLGSFAALQLSLGDAADKPTGALDEREQKLRDRAYRISYVLLTSVSLAGASVAVGFSEDGSVSTGPGATAIVVSFAALVGVLPTLAMAWMVPGSPDQTPSDQNRERIWIAVLTGLAGATFAVSLVVDLGRGVVAALLAAIFVLGLTATWAARTRRL